MPKLFFLHQQVKTVSSAIICHCGLFYHQVSFDELLLLCGQPVVRCDLSPADAQQREENAQVNAVHGAECASQSGGFKVNKNPLYHYFLLQLNQW